MNDSPGWASPGSSPSDPEEERGRDAPQDTPRTPPTEQSPSHWSAQQPPPAPGPGWGAPPPGPPGPAGWTAWNAPPPAAKPGVIPLRPLGVGEILDGAVSTARAHWRTVLGIALGVAILIQLASTVAVGLLLRDNTSFEALQNDPNPSSEEVMDALTGTLSSTGITLLATLIGTVVATAMLTIVVSRAVLGRSVSIGEAWREARPQLGRLLGLTLLVMLIVLGAFLVGLVPGLALALTGATVGGGVLATFGGIAGLLAGVWLWVRYCLSAPALMLERQGVLPALRRSAKLVRRSWWRVFGIQILAWLLVQIVGFIVQIPASVVGGVVDGRGLDNFLGGEATPTFTWPYLIIVGIGAVISSTLTLPLSAGITALLYMDQRIRREALDLELARAAGVPDDGAPGGPTPPPSPAAGS
ncbi:hypothetical protein [Streptomyces sp. JJ36]|uniref:DUF7544 domain-containing protein n=1 Tax=Streptomyces sp. JJ36 TaxID=2736645 RepID=UPI001F1FA849|nr:hypothetical protein [Streptomyces sp. JJ36]MCF6526388.1 hypothetical protein [Streptomyces sp. JJ36]